jgi:hypothetical protein
MFRALIAHHQEVLELCWSVHRFFYYNVPSLYGCIGGTRSRLQYWGVTISLLSFLGLVSTCIVCVASLVSYSCRARGLSCCGRLVSRSMVGPRMM